MAKPRLTEVADFAGVSEATVSRVLNERPGVAEVTKQQVLTALDVLGYERPSKLRSRSAGLVGLIVPELDNPIFPVLAQVLQNTLAQNGYTAVLCTQTSDSIGEDDYVSMLSEHGVSGIVFVSGLHADATADPERYRSLVQKRLPIVLVNGYTEGIDAPFLSTDDRAAMDVAVQHLVSLGHRYIGLATGPDRFVPVRRKREGFLAAMAKHLGTEEEQAELLIEVTMFTQHGGYAAGEALLKRGATAIVCGSDLMALGAIRAVRALEGTVPASCSVIGFDDSTLMNFTDPPLTTLRQPVQELGVAAVRALLEEINGDDTQRSEFLFAPELIVRGSTGTAPSVPLLG
jgi:LacI family transcriptional regulator, repressor for deo operon, udp, cdd, tsx, nupC, and nupG